MDNVCRTHEALRVQSIGTRPSTCEKAGWGSEPCYFFDEEAAADRAFMAWSAPLPAGVLPQREWGWSK